MNEKFLKIALTLVEDPRVLINAVCKRASDLAKGAKPLIPTMPDEERSHLDIALQEIAEGRIVIKTNVKDESLVLF